MVGRKADHAQAVERTGNDVAAGRNEIAYLSVKDYRCSIRGIYGRRHQYLNEG